MSTLFFNYSLDCELPKNTPYTEGTERQPFFGGPRTWEVAEASVRGFVRQMEELGARAGASGGRVRRASDAGRDGRDGRDFGRARRGAGHRS